MYQQKSPRNYAKTACNSCVKSRRKCEADSSHQPCKRCLEKHLECIYSPSAKKRGPKPKRNTLGTITHLHEEEFNPEVSEINKTAIFESDIVYGLQEIKPALSDRCANCYEQKKACEHSGIPGKFRCERCRKRKTMCLIQCIECYKKNKDKKETTPRCNNCKVIMEDPPLDYNFIRENDKIYLKFSNNAKIEITQEKFRDLLKLQKPGSLDDPNNQLQSSITDSEYSLSNNLITEPLSWLDPNYSLQPYSFQSFVTDPLPQHFGFNYDTFFDI
ncbi:9062_t:CDS:2 [Dentiscutata erythropus]|uniref:9062_t:CDS:1 n=1 Tax=Dentiscutata erythropus TaxID=1348616 RepID=A0A9N8VCL8_9GLOM|nr:9062_t:CDS:2 [Dentiscutata erythropus]